MRRVTACTVNPLFLATRRIFSSQTARLFFSARSELFPGNWATTSAIPNSRMLYRWQDHEEDLHQSEISTGENYRLLGGSAARSILACHPVNTSRALNPQPSTLNPQPSTLNPQPCTPRRRSKF